MQTNYVEAPIDPRDSRILYFKVTYGPRGLLSWDSRVQHLYQLRDLHPLVPGGRVTMQFEGEPTFSAYDSFGGTFIDARGIKWTCLSGSDFGRGGAPNAGTRIRWRVELSEDLDPTPGLRTLNSVQSTCHQVGRAFWGPHSASRESENIKGYRV